MTKKGVEAWWGFLGTALIVIVVVLFVIALALQIKEGGELSIADIGRQFVNIFR